MSDRVHRTVRPTLPEGYQYGDARKRSLEQRMAMDAADFLKVYHLSGLAEISPRTAWEQFGYIKSDPLKPYDVTSMKCDNGWHCYRPGAITCECIKRTRWHLEHPFRAPAAQRTGDETL